MKPLTKEETREHYDSLENFGDKSDTYYFKRRAEELLSFLSEIPRSSRILNMGCGDGKFSNFIKNHGFTNIVDADISISLLKSDKCPKRVLGDAENSSFNKDVFDAVIMTDVIEHIENRTKTIIELHRIVKENGKIFITYPNPLWVPILNALGKAGVKVDAKDGKVALHEFEDEIKPFFRVELFKTIMIMSKLPAVFLSAFEKIEAKLPKNLMNRFGLMHVYVIKRK